LRMLHNIADIDVELAKMDAKADLILEALLLRNW